MIRKLAVLAAVLLAVSLTTLWAQEPEQPASAPPVAATPAVSPAPGAPSEAMAPPAAPAPAMAARHPVPRPAAAPQAPAAPQVASPTPPPAPREKPAWIFYRLEYVLRELDGSRTVNSRSYTLLTQVSRWQQLRVSSDVPVRGFGSGSGSGAGTGSGPDPEHFRTSELFFSVDAQPVEAEGQLAVETRYEVKSLPEMNGTELPPGPLVRTWRGSCITLLVPGKPTVIAVSDDPGSKHRFELEVTATRMK